MAGTRSYVSGLTRMSRCAAGFSLYNKGSSRQNCLLWTFNPQVDMPSRETGRAPNSA
jgi:hypothetical protein